MEIMAIKKKITKIKKKEIIYAMNKYSSDYRKEENYDDDSNDAMSDETFHSNNIILNDFGIFYEEVIITIKKQNTIIPESSRCNEFQKDETSRCWNGTNMQTKSFFFKIRHPIYQQIGWQQQLQKKG